MQSESRRDASALQLLRLCERVDARERRLDVVRGEAAVFIHCSLSRALGVPLVFILWWEEGMELMCILEM